MFKTTTVAGAAFLLAAATPLAFADTEGNHGPSVTQTGPDLNFTVQCRGGGTRTVKGTWDTTTGKLDVTITVKNCKETANEVHNGTTTMTGTLKPATTGHSYSIDLTTHGDNTVTSSKGVKYSLVCDITKKGDYDDSTHLFTGTLKNSCTKDGSFLGSDNLVDYLLKPTANSGEDD